MEAVGVLMMCPMDSYLEKELDKRFNLYRYWILPQKREFLAQHASSIRAVIVNSSEGADAELIDALPNLEVISSFSMGLDKIDMNKCREKGITVTNIRDVMPDEVADLAIGLILAVLRKICVCDKLVRNGGWKFGGFKLTSRFSGKRVGIIGLGRIGSGIAKRAEAFGCPISYHLMSEKPDMNYKYHSSVVKLAADCDILVVACPLTPDTKHIVTREVIEALGPKGVVINLGRGLHVDENELVLALAEGRVRGAGLYVFEEEQRRVSQELMGLENVVVLSHVRGDTIETYKDMSDLVVGNLLAHFDKKPIVSERLLGAV